MKELSCATTSVHEHPVLSISFASTKETEVAFDTSDSFDHFVFNSTENNRKPCQK